MHHGSHSHKCHVTIHFAVTFATYNANGLLTAVYEGTRTISHVNKVAQIFYQPAVSVASIQQPHVNTPIEEAKITHKFTGYSVLLPAPPPHTEALCQPPPPPSKRHPCLNKTYLAVVSKIFGTMELVVPSFRCP